MRWLAAAVLLVAGVALADDNDSDGDSANVDEGDAHAFAVASVTARLEGTTARLTARFTIDAKAGVALDMGAIRLPPGGVVTAAAVTVHGARHPLRLVEADAAQRELEGLAAKPLAREHAWAMVIRGTGASLTMHALVAIDTKVMIELLVDAPTCFYRDARYVLVPTSWQRKVPAALRPTKIESELPAACSPPGPTLKWIGFASHQLGNAQRIGVIAGSLAVESARIARLELDLAPRVADIPADLATAIVIDHSRSMSASELESQRAVVASYLQLAPAARVQVIAYARRAQALLPAWMTAVQAAARVDRAIRSLAPANGSNLDVALREAASWLARTHGTKRIVLVTDERLPDRLTDLGRQLVPLVPAHTLVHVVSPNGQVALQRNDDAILAPLAKATEGIEVNSGEHVDATMLLRPTSLDHVEVKAAGWETFGVADMRSCDELPELAEGNACEWWGKSTLATGPISIEGLLWNHRVSRVVSPDATQARTLARVLTAANALDAELATQVARAAQAVDVVWSLFGSWGGKGGYEDLGGYGTIGLGRIGTASSHDVGTGTFTPRLSVLELAKLLRPAIERCKPASAKVAVTVETTLEEIVDVGVTLEPADNAVRDCIAEAVWDTTLTVAAAPEHAVTTVRYP